MNVLITAAGRRVELVNCFMSECRSYGGGLEVHAIDADAERSAACHTADRRAVSPAADDPGYADFLLRYCQDNDVRLVVPTNDLELPVLASLRRDFESRGIFVVVPEEDLVENCADKLKSRTVFEDILIPYPRIMCRESLSFPCFRKPIRGSGSVGVRRIDDESDLTRRELSEEGFMYMECVDEDLDEYTVDAYFDRDGTLLCAVPRRRIAVRAGEVSKGVTCAGAVSAYAFEKLGRLTGARGCVTMQVFSDPRARRVFGIEINSRYGGGYPLAYAAGANFPGSMIEEYLFDRGATVRNEWKAGLMMLRYDAHVLVG